MSQETLYERVKFEKENLILHIKQIKEQVDEIEFDENNILIENMVKTKASVEGITNVLNVKIEKEKEKVEKEKKNLEDLQNSLNELLIQKNKLKNTYENEKKFKDSQEELLKEKERQLKKIDKNKYTLEILNDLKSKIIEINEKLKLEQNKLNILKQNDLELKKKHDNIELKYKKFKIMYDKSMELNSKLCLIKDCQNEIENISKEIDLL